MSAKVFLDTNILVYAHDIADPVKREKSQSLIFQCLRKRSGVISAQVLSEFFVTITGKIKKPISLERAKKEIILFSTMETVDIDATLVLRALSIKSRWQLSYWDSLILSAAERAKCSIVYSEDMSDGQIYENLEVRNPFST